MWNTQKNPNNGISTEFFLCQVQHIYVLLQQQSHTTNLFSPFNIKTPKTLRQVTHRKQLAVNMKRKPAQGAKPSTSSLKSSLEGSGALRQPGWRRCPWACLLGFFWVRRWVRAKFHLAQTGLSLCIMQQKTWSCRNRGCLQTKFCNTEFFKGLRFAGEHQKMPDFPV